MLHNIYYDYFLTIKQEQEAEEARKKNPQNNQVNNRGMNIPSSVLEELQDELGG